MVRQMEEIARYLTRTFSIHRQKMILLGRWPPGGSQCYPDKLPQILTDKNNPDNSDNSYNPARRNHQEAPALLLHYHLYHQKCLNLSQLLLSMYKIESNPLQVCHRQPALLQDNQQSYLAVLKRGT
jgi:hypothetical protein